MIYLFLSIVLTAMLGILFKVFERFKINTFQTIVFNYITAASTSFLFSNGNVNLNTVAQQDWLLLAIGMGLLFISVFNAVGYAIPKIGISPVAVAQKMSVIIPVVFAILVYNEKVNLPKIAGIAVALVAILLATLKDKTQVKDSKASIWGFILVAILFVGSGLVDLFINFAQVRHFDSVDMSTFFGFVFGSAAVVGILSLSALVISKKMKFEPKSVLTGIILGVTNYASLYFLVKTLELPQFESSVIFPINNMGIIVVSAVAAMLFFKEKISKINWIGIGLSLVAIAIISFA